MQAEGKSMVGQLQVPGCVVILICRSQMGLGRHGFCNATAQCPEESPGGVI